MKTGVAHVQPILASVLTFVVYSITGRELTPPIVFSSIALFNTLRQPLTQLPRTITSAADAKVSLQRVEAMLLAPEIEATPSSSTDDKDAIKLEQAEFVWEEPVKVLPAVKSKGEKKGSSFWPSRGGRTAELDMGATQMATVRETAMLGATTMAIALDVTALPLREPTPVPSQSPSPVPSDRGKAMFTGLHDISLSIPQGTLVGVVGRVGSGKSSLLAALIGEMKRVGGSAFVRGTASYAPQSSWIQNATVRDNILFGLEYDEAKYRKALKCAALDRDLEILPDGDRTEIGERGIVGRSFNSIKRSSLPSDCFSDAFWRPKGSGQLGSSSLRRRGYCSSGRSTQRRRRQCKPAPL